MDTKESVSRVLLCLGSSFNPSENSFPLLPSNEELFFGPEQISYCPETIHHHLDVFFHSNTIYL